VFADGGGGGGGGGGRGRGEGEGEGVRGGGSRAVSLFHLDEISNLTQGNLASGFLGEN
jgi:hypothetical protein